MIRSCQMYFWLMLRAHKAKHQGDNIIDRLQGAIKVAWYPNLGHLDLKIYLPGRWIKVAVCLQSHTLRELGIHHTCHTSYISYNNRYLCSSLFSSRSVEQMRIPQPNMFRGPRHIYFYLRSFKDSIEGRLCTISMYFVAQLVVITNQTT